MGTTVNYGFPYPEGTEKVRDGDNAMKALADSLDTRVRLVEDKADAGSLVAGSNVTPGANVSVLVDLYRRGGVILLNWQVIANAALSNGATLFTLPSGYRPPVTWWVTGLDTTGPALVGYHCLPTGAFTVQQAITSGRYLRGHAVYPAGG